jgi:hypothetical protein
MAAQKKICSGGIAGAVATLMVVAAASPALARPAFNCGGAALLGGAQLLCSHVDP